MLNLIEDDINNVNEEHRGLYEERDGKHHLKVSGVEDTGALKRAKDREKQEKQDAQKQVGELQEKLKELTDKANAESEEEAKKAGDIEALENSWKDKLAKRESELEGQINGLSETLRTLLVDKEADRIAAEIAVEGSASVLAPHIKSRLSVAERDGKLTTIVNDEKGQVSALTLNDLKQEFANSKAFEPIVVGPRASGGGAGGSNNDGKGGANPAKSKSAEEAKKNGDLTGFLQASLNKQR